MTRLHELADQGQAVWLDYIRRSFLTSGELQSLIEKGVRGVTSNPSIFEKAIAGSVDYDKALSEMVDRDMSVDEIYETLATDDIREAAGLLQPVYDETDGVDGYVSIEVSPTLAHDTEGTVKEARRLHAEIGRDNVLIKVPSTPEGVPAIETLIGEGISVNVTLIFSVENYKDVANAYIAGLEKLSADGGDVSKVASVASFFISRVDTAADNSLDESGRGELAEALKGKIAIANSKVAYAVFNDTFSGPRWEKLAQQGAKVQRVLWASTSTKNPHYEDTLYVDSLIGKDTVNTIPPNTLTAFMDHGTVEQTLAAGLEEAREQLSQLDDIGVDLDSITAELQRQGVASFAKSFETLLESIRDKRDRIKSGDREYVSHLGEFEAAVQSGLEEMKNERVMSRIWQGDYTVWKPDPTEITNRLGWLKSPEIMHEQIPALTKFADEVRGAGFTNALLLGMGGSSLAPEVFAKVFGVKEGFLALDVLDSTDPGAVLALSKRLDPKKTLYVVSTKSGGTVETLSFFKFFFNQTVDAVGSASAGNHFIAITDPGSKLAEIADHHGFRKTFLNDPDIGGRYSALSYFGVVPAALIGMDLEALLQSAMKLSTNCESSNCPSEGNNAGALGGMMMATLAAAGRDKLTIIASPRLAPVGAWAEQLVAESLGKDGVGILPVDGEVVGKPESYGNDRFFFYMRLNEDATHDAAVKALVDAGHPLVQLNLTDPYELGGEFFRWEMATAIAGHRMSIHPFDQPNVEAAKVAARSTLATYRQEGNLPELEIDLEENGISVVSATEAPSLSGAWKSFLAQAQEGDYLCLQAFVQPGEAAEKAMRELQNQLRERTKLATTAAFGPRFLHSTGQLHKGDAGRGLFVQITSDAMQDVDIPDEAGSSESAVTFGTLIAAQALGDRQSLLDNVRRVIRFQVGTDVVGGFKKLMAALG